MRRIKYLAASVKTVDAVSELVPTQQTEFSFGRLSKME